MHPAPAHVARVLRNASRNLALEVMRGNQHVVYTGFPLATMEGTIGLARAPIREFDREFKEDAPDDAHGPVSARRMARCLLRNQTYHLTGDCASALIAVMCLDTDEPRGNRTALLVSNEGRFCGAFDTPEDAGIARKYLPSCTVVSSPADMSNFTEGVLSALKNDVAPTLKARSRAKLLEGVFTMAKAASKPEAPAPAAVEKTKKERVPKTDGPVAKVAAYVKENAAALKAGTLTKVQAVDALKLLGVVPGTIGVQLPRRLKELGIVAAKGSRAKPKEEKPPKAAKAADVPKAAAAPVKDSGLVPAKAAAGTKVAAPSKGAKKAAGKKK